MTGDLRRYPVSLDAATQLNLPEAAALVNALRAAADDPAGRQITVTVQASLTREELNRITDALPLTDVYSRTGSDELGWTIRIRAEDLLECERADSAQARAIAALTAEKRRPRDYDEIEPRTLDFLAELCDDANGDELNITPEAVWKKAAEHGITLEDLVMPKPENEA